MVDMLTHRSRWFVGGLLGLCACGTPEESSVTDATSMVETSATPTTSGETSATPTTPTTSGEASTTPTTPTTSGEASTSASSGDPTEDDGGPVAGWHVVTGTSADERVTGIHCASASGCAVATEYHLYAIDSTSVSSTLLTSDNELGSMVGILGEPAFLGFSRVGDRLIARLDAAGHGFISATGDFLEPASWTVETLGTTPGDFALNAQYGFGSDASGWLHFAHNLTYRAPSSPGPETVWTQVWSPQANPPVPADFAERRAIDPTLCTSDPGYSEAPRPTQAVHVASDLAIVLSPANALNQATEDATGVCISTDGGLNYHLAPLVGVESVNGPTALHCVAPDHCLVGGGAAYVDDSVYIYTSSDAPSGATSTWVRATIPAYTNGTTALRQFFFAPGGTHGWVVGANGNAAPLLWSTTDGGATWTDASGSVAALTSERLWAGFALDETHLVVGGEHGVILSNF